MADYAPVVQDATSRGDTRYDVRGLQKVGPRTWTDGRFTYTGDDPSSILSDNRPNPSPGAASPGGGGGDYGGDLTASPYFQQFKSQIEAANAADLANTKSQLQSLLIQFGLVPEGFQDKYGALDDAIKQLIQQNTNTGVSQYARLLQAQQDAKERALHNLTARGLGRSGAKGYALRRGTLTFNQNLSDALNAVLGNANNLQGGYASRSMDRTNSLAQFLAQLASQYSFRGVGSPAPIAPPPTDSGGGATPPSYSSPGFAHLGVGVPNAGGYAIQTGGGYYTNPNTGDLTSKWTKLAGL